MEESWKNCDIVVTQFSVYQDAPVSDASTVVKTYDSTVEPEAGGQPSGGRDIAVISMSMFVAGAADAERPPGRRTLSHSYRLTTRTTRSRGGPVLHCTHLQNAVGLAKMGALVAGLEYPPRIYYEDPTSIAKAEGDAVCRKMVCSCGQDTSGLSLFRRGVGTVVKAHNVNGRAAGRRAFRGNGRRS